MSILKFDEKDLITWSNRDKAVIGNEYYFASSLDTMEHNVEKGVISQLINIDKDDYACTFKGNDDLWYACILPVEAVKDNEPKKYRPCKTIKEFYEVINNYGSDSFPNKDFTDENFMYNLLDSTIHVRTINIHTEYYFSINCIRKHEKGDIEILMTLNKCYLSFEQIFTSYEIELNGKWVPFGILDENN